MPGPAQTPHSPASTPHCVRRIAIIGGGAAGYFAAITAAEANPAAQVTIYEQSKRTLQKVKISGGGRCNVTHHCFDPKELATRYPRGSRELRAAFHRWQPQDSIDWFAARGVALKTESDGRIFPTTDDSQTIIDCFHQSARHAGVILRKECGVKNITHYSSPIIHPPSFIIHLSDDSQESADLVCLTAGSLKASPLTRALEALGHHIEPLAPSLFAFNLADKRTHGLAGLAAQKAQVSLVASPQTPPPHLASQLAAAPKTANPEPSLSQTGPILITHRGLSGPAILRLSAWEARSLQAANYHFEIEINWLGGISENQLRAEFARLRKGKTLVKTKTFEAVPRRLWERLIEAADIPAEQKWAQLPKDKESALVRELTAGRYAVQGKTTNNNDVNISHAGKITGSTTEFVTAGGVRRKEIDWRTMESKLVPNLYFAGECIDYDGITGGFNFQGAWTTARIAGLAMAESG